jgi:hypothetical protein
VFLTRRPPFRVFIFAGVPRVIAGERWHNLRQLRALVSRGALLENKTAMRNEASATLSFVLAGFVGMAGLAMDGARAGEPAPQPIADPLERGPTTRLHHPNNVFGVT